MYRRASLKVGPLADTRIILRLKEYDHWLGIDERGGDPRPPLDLLHPMDSKLMKMTPANPAVGNWRDNGPEMLDGPE